MATYPDPTKTSVEQWLRARARMDTEVKVRSGAISSGSTPPITPSGSPKRSASAARR